MVAASSVSALAASKAVLPPSFPPPREVARPVSNLGNTCYMNAVLQALAHAPELCLATDVEPHNVTCPIAMENRKRRAASPTSSPEDQHQTQQPQTENDIRRINKEMATRKLRRSSRKSPTNDEENASPSNNNSPSDSSTPKYCALCELEWHLQEVHAPKSSSDSNSNNNKPVAPSFFVHGFIDHVAPSWFKLGQQEDSHEFLRLLIDAMQRSCKNARPKMIEQEEDIPSIGEEEKDTKKSDSNNNSDEKDTEYPFQLFRGTVESCVTCDSCKATSSTTDPIEDVGLEVTSTSSSSGVNTRGGGPVPGEALADVNSAFQRFARVEALDAGYKCEKCNKNGRATKQSRLAKVPPILTLHLKRFRYGANDGRGPAGPPGNNSRRTSSKSGSAKIEGHIKFEQIFNLKPYLTDKLQKEMKKSLFCRLFAVIVHAGKNSHSGHYVAYVRNVKENEWWKMDDARISMASWDEVKEAEAYMLFYRVVDHPVAAQLQDKAKRMREEREAVVKRLAAEAAKEEEKKAAAMAKETADTEKENLPTVVNESKASDSPSAPAAVTPVKATADSPSKPEQGKQEQSPASTAGGSTAKKEFKPAPSNSGPPSANTRKRSLPDYLDGRSWAKANTRLKSSQYSSLRSAEEYINENVQFKSDFFKRLTEEGSKPNAKVDHCPIKHITGDDVVGGYSKFSLGLKKTVHRIAMRYKEEHGDDFFTVPVAASGEGTTKSNLLDKFVAVGSASGDDGGLL